VGTAALEAANVSVILRTPIVYAGAPTISVAYWLVDAAGRPQVLAFAGFASDPSFNDAVVTAYAPGRLLAVSDGKALNATDRVVTGIAVHMVTLTFRVQPNVTAGVKANVLSGRVRELVGTGTYVFLADTAARVLDAQPGVVTQGQLVVAEVAPAGLYAYAASAELFNTAPLTGQEVATQVAVMQAFNRAGQADAAAGAAACRLASAADAAVATVTAAPGGCRVAVNSGHTGGSAAVGVVASYGGLQASVTVRVWYPQRLRLAAGDTQLQRVDGAHATDDCSRPLYQQTEVAGYADFGGAGRATAAGLDVTCMLRLVSNDSSVVVSTDGRPPAMDWKRPASA
jgi:hypothetical protein